jgi:hypothetical protein
MVGRLPARDDTHPAASAPTLRESAFSTVQRPCTVAYSAIRDVDAIARIPAQRLLGLL